MHAQCYNSQEPQVDTQEHVLACEVIVSHTALNMRYLWNKVLWQKPSKTHDKKRVGVVGPRGRGLVHRHTGGHHPARRVRIKEDAASTPDRSEISL